MTLSATMMLRQLGLDSIANSIATATATFDLLNAEKVRTAVVRQQLPTSLRPSFSIFEVF